MNIIITEKAKNILIKLYSNKIHRIMPKVMTWAGITYVLVQDEQQNDDSLYDIDGLFFIISKEDEKYVKYIEIDYIDDLSGADFVITAGF